MGEINIDGNKYNRLTVIKKTEEKSNDGYLWECKCDCGNIVKVKKWNFTSGNTKSCGCYKNEKIANVGRMRLDNLTGKEFGRLFVIKRSYTKQYNGGTIVYWACKCDCGNETTVKTSHLKDGKIRSCGCLEKENLNKISVQVTHGQTKTKLYYVWNSMRMRCRNPNTNNYHNYGGRGITVCKEWNESFEPFYEWAIFNGYKHGLTIDRINNDSNYDPSNCRWATYKEQAANTRKTLKI